MPQPRSMLGVYEGYTDVVADGYARESVYVTMPDGCRIAVDALHPTKNGEPLTEPLPTVLHATPYRRSFEIAQASGTAARYANELRGMEPGELVTQYEERPIARDLIHHGYHFVSVDIRGTGASFGAEYGDSWLAGQDLAAVIDWICEQPWSSGRVGMVGISYEGMMQFFTAAHHPEGLKCIAPQYPGLPQCYVDGGLAISSFARVWESLHKGMSENEPSAPVDGPDGEALRAEAESERSSDRYRWVETFSEMDPRDVTRMSSYDGIRRRRPRPRPRTRRGRQWLGRLLRHHQREWRPHLPGHGLVGPDVPRLPDRRVQPARRTQEADRRSLEPRTGRRPRIAALVRLLAEGDRQRDHGRAAGPLRGERAVRCDRVEVRAAPAAAGGAGSQPIG